MELKKMVLLAFLIHQLSAKNDSKEFSGIYIENSLNQTVRLESIVPKVNVNMKKYIFDILNIDPKPDTGEELSNDQNVAAFVMEFYNYMSGNVKYNYSNLQTRQERFDILNEDVVNYEQNGNLILTVVAQSRQAISEEAESVGRIAFDTLEMSFQDKMLKAELKLYRSSENISPEFQGPVTLMVYRFLSTKSANGSEDARFLESVNINFKDGWVSMIISEALSVWLENPKMNRGLFLRARSENYPGKMFNPEEFGIVGFTGDLDKKPFAVGYFHRTTQEKGIPNLKFPAPADSEYEENQETSCRKHHLYMNFEEWQWQNWMIAPKGYHLNYCSGTCNYRDVLGAHATKHALMQSLINLVNPSTPKPDCAPTSLLPISFVYRVDELTYALRTYQGMSVESCACH